jgi:hypothetical protein
MKAFAFDFCPECPNYVAHMRIPCSKSLVVEGVELPGPTCPLLDVPERENTFTESEIRYRDKCVEFVTKLRGMK